MNTREYNESVDRFADNIFRFVLKNIKDEDKAKDIVQDTFEKLWIKARDVSYQKVRSYLFTTAYHTTIDVIRKSKYVSDADVNDLTHTGQGEQYTGLKEILDKALNKLPEIQKNVILLRDYEGYSYKEIGEITNLNESQVKVYIYRARVFLKEYIGSIETVI
jgi:RNA polymerase sigma-70 factor (ECF subfamily)